MQIHFQLSGFVIKTVLEYGSFLVKTVYLERDFLPGRFGLERWIVSCHEALFKKSPDKELQQGITHLKLQIQSKRNRNNTLLNFITYLAVVSSCLKYES